MILYYKPPSDKIFEEVKKACIKIWNTHDNTFGYVDEKVDRIKDIPNASNNFMYMVSMFDHWHKEALGKIISPESKKAIVDRIKSGYDSHEVGMKMELNPFL